MVCENLHVALPAMTTRHEMFSGLLLNESQTTTVDSSSMTSTHASEKILFPCFEILFNKRVGHLQRQIQ